MMGFHFSSLYDSLYGENLKSEDKINRYGKGD